MDKKTKAKINKLESKALSSEDILDAINGKANLIAYPDIVNYKNIKDLLGKYNACIILYQTKENFGHWTCVFKNKYGYNFFDSYGIKPDFEIKFIPKYYREDSGQSFTHLTYLLAKTKKPIEYNDVKLQKLKSGVNTCGRWVTARLILKDMPIKDFVKFFRSKYLGLTPDQLVTYLTGKI